jgi:hypothetical protein
VRKQLRANFSPVREGCKKKSANSILILTLLASTNLQLQFFAPLFIFATSWSCKKLSASLRGISTPLQSLFSATVVKYRWNDVSLLLFNYLNHLTTTNEGFKVDLDALSPSQQNQSSQSGRAELEVDGALIA